MIRLGTHGVRLRLSVGDGNGSRGVRCELGETEWRGPAQTESNAKSLRKKKCLCWTRLCIKRCGCTSVMAWHLQGRRALCLSPILFFIAYSSSNLSRTKAGRNRRFRAEPLRFRPVPSLGVVSILGQDAFALVSFLCRHSTVARFGPSRLERLPLGFSLHRNRDCVSGLANRAAP